MNEIDEILSNIDKDDGDDLFHSSGQGEKKGVPGEAPGGEGAGASADDAAAEDADDAAAEEIHVENLPEERISVEEAAAETPGHKDMGEFSVKGTKTWNTKEPYTIKIDPEHLRKDLDDLARSFHFVDKPADIEAVRGKIKQEMLKFLRKPTEHITDRYSDFIYRSIISIMQDISKSFELNEENEKLFVYHIGPLTIYRIQKDEFSQKGYGFCYKYLPGNKAVRFFPAEFVKAMILKWHEENIHVLDLPFDSIQKYEEIKNLVTKQYQGDLRVFNTRLEQLHAKIEPDKLISRSKLFRLKGIEWFGFLRLEIYKRFLGSSIFV
jgi:hypothetical protein